MRTPRLSSVAFKLAGATVALMAMATAGIYLRLSAYQRENLLRAKEQSASAVIRLFADSCAAAVVFEDHNELRNTLAILGRNEDIEYASIWAVDRTGVVTRQLAELSRGRSETVAIVPASLTLRRDLDRVVSIAPVRDVKGNPVAVLVAAFSLAREHSAIVRLERTALLISTGVAAGLTLLLIAMARLVVVGRLAKLVGAAVSLGEGREIRVDESSDDEIGQLARAFGHMASAIRVREERINARNRDMRLVLDNVGQGFITLDVSGALSEERSRVVDQWFGCLDGSPKLWDYIRRHDPAFADYFEVGWSAVVDQVLPLALCLDQLPHTVHNDGRTWRLDYHPILNGDALDKTVVVITDISSTLEKERSEQRQRETMSIYRRLIADRPAFEDFYAEAAGLVTAIADAPSSDLSLIKRQVHTLKGNCSLFGIESVAELCHSIESGIEDSGALDDADRTRLRASWAVTAASHAALVQGGAAGQILVARSDYESLLLELECHAAYPALIDSVHAWRFEHAAKRLALVAEQIERLASRLGRAKVDVICERTTLRLPPRKWSPFWSAFAHVIRNTVDHGVETADKRIAAGKPPHATVRIAITREDDLLVVRIDDDGPGLDWRTVADKAHARGLPWRTHAELEEALFSDGLSSCAESGATSGRGIGLGAVRSAVAALGGRVQLTSNPGGGTSLRCWLPASLLAPDQAPRPVVAAPAIADGPRAPAARSEQSAR
jgi:HPt (histidine-containing phosphotransfer) domain-containing protein/HAMP domain-containing protein